MELGAATRPQLGHRSRRPDRHRPVSGAARVRPIAAVVLLIPSALSYIGAMTQVSNSSMGIRTVEWLRDNGAAGLVASVESIYYSLTAPSKGGPTLRALPKVGY